MENKIVKVSRFGYNRIVSNFQKFGWEMDSVTEMTKTSTRTTYEGRVIGDEVHIEERNHVKKKVFVEIDMHRDEDSFLNLKAIKVLELFFNIIYLLRRLLALVLPIVSVVLGIVVLLGNGDLLFEAEEGELPIGLYWILGLFGWVVLIIIENILASIASKNLVRRN